MYILKKRKWSIKQTCKSIKGFIDNNRKFTSHEISFVVSYVADVAYAFWPT